MPDSYILKKQLSTWYITILVLIALIVMIGGITRLTESGLSIANWRPLMGTLPPMSEHAWQKVFSLYQTTPEFIKINHHFTLSEFKLIFFWEYIHRLLGRIIGLTIILPFLYFLYKKKLDIPKIKSGLVMIFLIASQGILGWFMVKSGLSDNPAVSHFRLASHLCLAFFIFQYVFIQLLTLFKLKNSITKDASFRKAIHLLSIIVFIQIIYGAFTAGLDAGLGFNTFPKMGSHWVPQGLFSLDPIFKNLFYNHITVQFMHRLFAWILTFFFIYMYLFSSKFNLNEKQKFAFRITTILFCIQFILGVLTLVLKVPIFFAVAHQLGALLLLTSLTHLNFINK